MLKYVLLGFLNYGPQTGYDIKKRMDKSTQFFWHARLSQIYPTLKKFAEQGLTEVRVVPQEGKPDKKIYAITKAGRAALTDWLAESENELPLTKDPVLLKLFLSGALDDKEMILRQLHHQLTLHRKRLAYFQEETVANIEQCINQTDSARESIFWELTRHYGEEHERTYIHWLEHAVKTIEQKL